MIWIGVYAVMGVAGILMAELELFFWNDPANPYERPSRWLIWLFEFTLWPVSFVMAFLSLLRR